MGFFTSHEKPEDAAPGTVHLVDLEGIMVAKHAKGGQHDIVLVPAPSSDPDDPVSDTRPWESCVSELTGAAKLVASTQSTQYHMHGCLHVDGRHRKRGHLFDPGAHS